MHTQRQLYEELQSVTHIFPQQARVLRLPRDRPHGCRQLELTIRAPVSSSIWQRPLVLNLIRWRPCSLTRELIASEECTQKKNRLVCSGRSSCARYIGQARKEDRSTNFSTSRQDYRVSRTGTMDGLLSYLSGLSHA